MSDNDPDVQFQVYESMQSQIATLQREVESFRGELGETKINLEIQRKWYSQHISALQKAKVALEKCVNWGYFPHEEVPLMNDALESVKECLK